MNSEMIFPITIEQVLDGSQIQVRQLVKDGEELGHSLHGYRNFVFTPTPEHPFSTTCPRFKVGESYEVQSGPGEKVLAHIKIRDIRQERLQDISEIDVIAEGCALQAWATHDHDWPHTAAFAALWDTIHTKPGDMWQDNPWVWVLMFSISEDE